MVSNFTPKTRNTCQTQHPSTPTIQCLGGITVLLTNKHLPSSDELLTEE